MTKFKTHLLGYLAILLIAYSFIYAKELKADWPGPQEDKVDQNDDYQYEEDPIAETNENDYITPATSEPPAWPIENTEPAVSPDDLDKSFSDKTEAPMPEDGWSGGADLTTEEKEKKAVVYTEEDYDNSFMPLGTADLMVDDGNRTLAASIPPGHGITNRKTAREFEEVLPDFASEEESPFIGDAIKDWIAKEGFTLREILTLWADEGGWEVIWNTEREYPLKASAIFRGRFNDVSAALVRSFAKADPPPYAKFYKGNRVIVVRTLEDDNGN